MRTTDGHITVNFPPVGAFHPASLADTKSDTYAVFGTLFWRPSDAWEVSAGLRWDRQDRVAKGVQTSAFPNALFGLPPAVVLTGGKIKETNLSPRVAVTRHWNGDLMTYASVARGATSQCLPPSGSVSVRWWRTACVATESPSPTQAAARAPRTLRRVACVSGRPRGARRVPSSTTSPASAATSQSAMGRPCLATWNPTATAASRANADSSEVGGSFAEC